MALSQDMGGVGMPMEQGLLLGFGNLTAITAAGTTSGTATVLGALQNNVHVTSAANQTGVRLPAAANLSTFYFVRTTAASTATANVYPPTGGAINGLGTDVAVPVSAGTAMLFYPVSYGSGAALTWNCFDGRLATNNTWAGNQTFTGTITPSGGIVSSLSTMSPRLWSTGNQGAITTTTPGTDTTPVVTETYLAELFVPTNISSTGVSVFCGSASGGNFQLYLSNAASTNLAATASTAQSVTAGYQQIPWTGGPITILGPATYFVLLQCNNVAARYRSHAIGNFASGKLTGTTYGTFPTSFAAPTTFTASLGPMASLY